MCTFTRTGLPGLLVPLVLRKLPLLFLELGSPPCLSYEGRGLRPMQHCKRKAKQPRHPGCAGTCGAGTAGASLSLPSGATVKQRWPWLSLYRVQLPSADTSQGEGGAGCSSAVAHSGGTTA